MPTNQEVDILRHSLGLTNAKTSYRNYFNAEPGHSDMPLLRSLIEQGLMYENRHDPKYFHVTEAGIEVATRG